MSPISKQQAIKIIKAAAYVGISAVLGYILALLEGNPQMFGVYTPIINVALVTIKQAFTTDATAK